MFCPACDKTLVPEEIELTPEENAKAETVRQAILDGKWDAKNFRRIE
jgi:hypothetical protein